MPLPSSIDDLSIIPGDNFPLGTDAPDVLDNVIREHAAYIAQLRNGQDAVRDDLASPATGKGAEMVATGVHTFSTVAQALAAIDWADQQDAMRVNLLDFVDKADWSKITNGTAIYDCTAAFQAAINHCKAQQLGPSGTLYGGSLTLVLPRGFFVVSDDLLLTGFNGFRIIGAGAQATQVVFTKENGTLFYFNGYLNIEVSHMSLFEGNVSLSGGKPIWTPHATKSSTCFRFNGATSGTDFTQNGLVIGSFALVYKTTDGVVNCDNHVHNQCRYFTNLLVWENSNPNAVIWAFNECKAYYNTNVFLNPGSTMRVNGGDWINPGDFLTGNLANTCTDLIFDGLRFESYQNINPSANPRLMVLSSTHNITFRNCTQRGGGSLVGKTSATLAGLYNIKVERCWLPGDWQATVGTSQDGITSSLIFEECDGVPNVVQTLVGGQSSRPLNIEYRRHRQSTSGYVDRIFHGALPSQNRAITDETARDMYRFEAVLNASSTSKSCPVFVVSPYIMQFCGAEIEFWSNGIQTVVIDIWTDSTKTTKLGTVTTAVAQNQYQMLEIPLSGVLARHQITTASNPLFVELTAANNAGTCRANVTLKYRQVN